MPGGEGTWVRVRWKDTGTQVSYPGSGLSEEEQAKLSEQAVKQFDGAEAYVQLDVRNRMSQVRVGSALAPQAWSQLLNVLEVLTVTVPARPPAEWNAQRRTHSASTTAPTAWSPQQGQELLLSKKKRYQKLTTVGTSLDGEQSLQEKHVQNLGKARLRFSLEERRLLSAEGHFRTVIHHSLMDADIDETYSLQPAPLESLTSVAPPSPAELGVLLARMVEVNPRVALEQSRAPVTVRPGLVNLDPKQFVRKLNDTVDKMRALENFDPQSEQARPLMDDLATLCATNMELARRTLRPALTNTDKQVSRRRAGGGGERGAAPWAPGPGARRGSCSAARAPRAGLLRRAGRPGHEREPGAAGPRLADEGAAPGGLHGAPRHRLQWPAAGRLPGLGAEEARR